MSPYMDLFPRILPLNDQVCAIWVRAQKESEKNGKRKETQSTNFTGDEEEVCVFVPRQQQQQPVVGCCARTIEVSESDKEWCGAACRLYNEHLDMASLVHDLTLFYKK